MNIKKILPIIMAIFLSVLPLRAQFYKVYGYQSAEAGEIEFSLWNSYIPSSDTPYPFFGKDLSREGLLAHSLELEYGLSNRFGIAAYVDFEDPKEGGIKYVRTKAIMAHYAFFEKGSRPVDIAIYLEYIINKKEYKDYEELEMRLILENAGSQRSRTINLSNSVSKAAQKKSPTATFIKARLPAWNPAYRPCLSIMARKEMDFCKKTKFTAIIFWRPRTENMPSTSLSGGGRS
jgi:hypothetical protein